MHGTNVSDIDCTGLIACSLYDSLALESAPKPEQHFVLNYANNSKPGRFVLGAITYIVETPDDHHQQLLVRRPQYRAKCSKCTGRSQSNCAGSPL